MKTALTAGNVQQGAVNGRHPEIGRTSVKHHAEGLRRGSQGDVAIVLCLVKTQEGSDDHTDLWRGLTGNVPKGKSPTEKNS